MKFKKVIPFVVLASLLVGCSKDLTIQNGTDQTIVKPNDNYKLDLTNYQEIFDELFASNGPETAANEIIYRIAKQVVETTDSTDENTKRLETALLGTKGEYKVAGYTATYSRLAEKIKEKLNQYYSASYKLNGLFDERILANSLRSSGYNIVLGNDYFKETPSTLVRYDDLADHLKGDYSDLIENSFLKSIYLEILKEEYVLTQHPEYLKSTQTSSSSQYSAYSKVKYVEYFSYTPEKSSDANKINSKIEELLEKALGTNKDKVLTKDEFKTLVVDGFEPVIKEYDAEKLNKEFAKIDYLNKDNEKFLNIYDQVEKDKLTKSEIDEATTLINTYSNNGSHDIYTGKALKDIDLANKKYYNESVVSTKSSTVINSDIDAKLKVANDKLDLTKNGFLDFYNNDNPLFKLDGTYYIVRVETIYNHKYVDGKSESSSDAALLDALQLLGTHSSYTSNAIKYYLDEFYEAGKLSIHNEEIYNYLNETYSFDIED